MDHAVTEMALAFGICPNVMLPVQEIFSRTQPYTSMILP